MCASAFLQEFGATAVAEEKSLPHDRILHSALQFGRTSARERHDIVIVFEMMETFSGINFTSSSSSFSISEQKLARGYRRVIGSGSSKHFCCLDVGRTRVIRSVVVVIERRGTDQLCKFNHHGARLHCGP
jgi:hypothetical protein